MSGALLADRAAKPAVDVATGTREVTVHASHSLQTLPYVQTSHGRVITAVTRRIANDGVHTWARYGLRATAP